MFYWGGHALRVGLPNETEDLVAHGKGVHPRAHLDHLAGGIPPQDGRKLDRESVLCGAAPHLPVNGVDAAPGHADDDRATLGLRIPGRRAARSFQRLRKQSNRRPSWVTSTIRVRSTNRGPWRGAGCAPRLLRTCIATAPRPRPIGSRAADRRLGLDPIPTRGEPAEREARLHVDKRAAGQPGARAHRTDARTTIVATSSFSVRDRHPSAAHLGEAASVGGASPDTVRSQTNGSRFGSHLLDRSDRRSRRSGRAGVRRRLGRRGGRRGRSPDYPAESACRAPRSSHYKYLTNE